MAGARSPDRNGMIMSGQRHQEYIGRHSHRYFRAGGQHRKDKLPPPDTPPPPRRESYLPPPVRTAPGLISSEREVWSEWYDPSKLRGIDPDLIAPARTEELTRPIPGRMPEPAKRVNTKNITALTVTFIVAVPALLCAGWVMHDNQLASNYGTNYGQLAPETKTVPVNMVVRGKPLRICMALTNYGSSWRAWPTSAC